MPNAAKITVGAIPRDCPGANGRDVGQPQGVAPTGNVLLLPNVVCRLAAAFVVVVLLIFFQAKP